jgi:hypothetical protein
VTFDPAAEFERQAAHLTQLAMSPGWYAYAREQARAMQADKNAQGLWRGMYATVCGRIKDAGFVPAGDEMGQWWVT